MWVEEVDAEVVEVGDFLEVSGFKLFKKKPLLPSSVLTMLK